MLIAATLMIGGTLTWAQQSSSAYLGARTVVKNGQTQVLDVVSGSPAATAGLQTGDVIVALNATTITADQPLETLLASLHPGDQIQLTVVRNAQSLTVPVTLGQRPASADLATGAATSASIPTLAAGPTLPPVTPNAAGGFLGARMTSATDGVHIVGVVGGGPADLAGLKSGDIIVALDDQPVNSTQQVQAILNTKRPGDTLKVRISRGGQSVETTVHLTVRPADSGAPAAGSPSGLGARFPALGFSVSVQTDGLHVTGVTAGGIAEKGSLRVDDVIVAVGGQPFDPTNIVPTIVRLSTPGPQQLSVIRAGQTVTVQWTLVAGGEDVIAAQTVRLGVTYDVVTQQTAAELKLSVTAGALVKAVAPGSPADLGGIKSGDVITAVEDDRVDAKRTLAIRMIPYGTGDTVTLTVVRGTDTLKLPVTLANGGNALAPSADILL